MKRLFFIFVLLLMSFAVYAQEPIDDFIVGPIPVEKERLMGPECIPTSSTPFKYIKVNFHFMLDDAGQGNFNESGNNHIPRNYQHTGYWYAQELINMANYRWYCNIKMSLPPGNRTEVLEPKLRYVLQGVYFHRDSDNCVFSFSSGFTNTYAVDKGSAINVFFVQQNGTSKTNYANMSGNRFVVMQGCWESYCANYTSGYGLWVIAGSLNHEVGHNLNLHHTMRYSYGPCDWNAEDYCADTPTRQAMNDLTGQDPCCGWGGGSDPKCSNNFMDYSGSSAITPQQLGRMHDCLETELVNYWAPSLACNKINAKMSTVVRIPYLGSIIMDGSKSSTEKNLYFISVQKSDSSWNRYGYEHCRWLSSTEAGKIGAFNIRTFCSGKLSLSPGNYYRVKLAVSPWHSQTILIYLEPNPSPNDPTDPIEKPLPIGEPGQPGGFEAIK